ncbi:MAG: YceI family protein [Saprospirales bacterium]|nr:MAG: YceI family protein [Saprospirales bacterium]
MKIISLALLLVFSTGIDLQAQSIYFTREGKVSFFSEAPLENIEAHNHRASSVIDLESCKIEFSVLIRGFMFEKSLMQEHFNENYMESHLYPRATFKGNFINCDEIDFEADGTYPFEVEGELEMRDISQSIAVEGVFTIKNGHINGKAGFTVLVADYDIRIPAIVRDNIAREIEVTIDADYRKLER